ncbi:hypothetical protein CHS0354_024115 [Potamilus streckersoni]|uniref:Uncharacterized protein n=1 Tax=Potamilus streckersoni TaxID=2493646 RepID=A0AAE0RZG1_9BIVA|nr:hypothetical protein CHS0354_024115 [Potamilus streckersoni]
MEDTLSIAEELISAGEDEKVAKAIARLLRQGFDFAKLEYEKSLEQKSLATKGDLEVTKLELSKEIETVKLELTGKIETVKLELTKEIELVRKDVETVKLELTKEIELVRKDVETVKLELQKEIRGVEVRLLKWLIGVVISGVVSLVYFFVRNKKGLCVIFLTDKHLMPNSLIHETDTLSIAEELISAGEDEKVAKAIARLLRQGFDFAKLEYEKSLEQKSLATKGDLEVTKLELTKEIEFVRKEIEVVRKEVEVVKKEIEVVKKDVETVKLELSKEIETVKLELTGKIETVKLELTKEIELVRKDVETVKLELTGKIETVKLELTKEIELVRKDVETVKLELQKEIKGVEVRLLKWLIGVVISGVVSLGSFMYFLFSVFLRS